MLAHLLTALSDVQQRFTEVFMFVAELICIDLCIVARYSDYLWWIFYCFFV